MEEGSVDSGAGGAMRRPPRGFCGAATSLAGAGRMATSYISPNTSRHAERQCRWAIWCIATERRRNLECRGGGRRPDGTGLSLRVHRARAGARLASGPRAQVAHGRRARAHRRRLPARQRSAVGLGADLHDGAVDRADPRRGALGAQRPGRRRGHPPAARALSHRQLARDYRPPDVLRLQRQRQDPGHGRRGHAALHRGPDPGHGRAGAEQHFPRGVRAYDGAQVRRLPEHDFRGAGVAGRRARRAREILIKRLPNIPGAGWISSSVAIWAGFLFLYVFFPNRRVRIEAAAVGALVASILLQIAQWAFIYFQYGSTLRRNLRRARLDSGVAHLDLHDLGDRAARRRGHGRLRTPQPAADRGPLGNERARRRAGRRAAAGRADGRAARHGHARHAVGGTRHRRGDAGRGAAAARARRDRDRNGGRRRQAASADLFLARDSSTIGLGEVLECVRGGGPAVVSSDARVAAMVERLRQAERETLGGLTVRDLIERTASAAAPAHSARPRRARGRRGLTPRRPCA